MIEITVLGQTYDIRECLKDNKFQWNPDEKVWWKRESEAKLNHTLEAIRPHQSWSERPSPRVQVFLRSVDINGNELSSEVLSIKLKPVGEKAEVDFLDLFGQVIAKASASPRTDKKKENVDKAFF